MDSYDYTGTYFDAFPAKNAGYVMSLFCLSCRSFLSKPTVDQLLAALSTRIISDRGSEKAELLEQVAQSLETPEAREVAAFVIERESLPRELRAQLKAERQREYRARYMSQQPPTEKQLALLKKIAPFASPSSKAEACALIESLLKERVA